jgi:dipeptidyl aminopeptidase/acylaminoacyl peptidase
MAVDRMQWGAEDWQVADLYMPNDPSPYQKDVGIPCMMLIHGGFWKSEYGMDLMAPIAEDLAESGIAAWNIEFKRTTADEEGVWMDTMSDIMRAWGQLALLPGIDIVRSGIIGHSAGGQLALLLASKAERKPWLVVAQAPIADLVAADRAELSDDGDAARRWLGCSPEQNQTLWDQLNPISNIPKCPVLLIHGKNDEEVPWSQSDAYIRALKAQGEEVQTLWLPGDHFSIIDVASDDWLVQKDAIFDWF